MIEGTTSDQANREAELLREPLLDKNSTNAAEEEVQVVAALSSPSMGGGGGCQQRGTNDIRGTIGDVEALEEEEAREETPKDLVGTKEIRHLWILFQCVWPALVLFSTELWYVGPAFFVVAMVPCLLVFILLAATNKKKASETFQRKDFAPTALWCWWCFLGSNEEVAQMVVAVALFLLFLLVLLVTLLTILLSFNHGPGAARDWLGYQIRSFCRFDYFRHLEEEHMEKLQEREVAQQELLERQRAHLAHLEDLAQKRPPKRPTWILPVLAVVGVCQLAFLFYAGYGLIPSGQPETVVETTPIPSFADPSP